MRGTGRIDQESQMTGNDCTLEPRGNSVGTHCERGWTDSRFLRGRVRKGALHGGEMGQMDKDEYNGLRRVSVIA